MKEVVNYLKKNNISLHHTHMIVHRPWGTYTILEESEHYKIKRIVVRPGKRLSLQKHYHRSEHWIVVSGTALVAVGERETLVRANESTYIAMGEKHRLENPGKIDLVIIEAQVGEYLEEDDIVRFNDDFERAYLLLTWMNRIDRIWLFSFCIALEFKYFANAFNPFLLS